MNRMRKRELVGKRVTLALAVAMCAVLAVGLGTQPARADEPKKPVDEATKQESGKQDAATAEADDAETDKAASEKTETEKKVSYFRDIRPILQEHCLGCHQPAKAEGGLDLTSVAGMLRGGESEEPAVVVGQADESPLVWQIEPSDGEPPAMPKDAEPLAAADVALIRQWIDQGAEDDTPASNATPIDMEHPPQYTEPPVLTAVAYSPDGKLLAVSGYHEVLLYEADGSALVARLVGMSERIESLAFSPDGQRLGVTGGSPGRLGEVQIWNVPERRLELSLPVTHDTVFGGSFSVDGTRFAFGCTDNSLRAIEVATGKQVLFQGAHNDWVLDTTWSKDDSHLISVSRDRSMKLTEVATQRFVDNITSITPGALKGGLMTVERHPTEDHVLTAGADGQPKLYQIYRTKKRQIGDDYNRLRSYEALPGRAYAVCFNREGTRFAVCSSAEGKGEVRVYQTDDGKRVCTCQGQQGPVYDVAFHPDGTRLASVGFDGWVRINDAETGQLITQFRAVPEKLGDRADAAETTSQPQN